MSRLYLVLGIILTSLGLLFGLLGMLVVFSPGFGMSGGTQQDAIKAAILTLGMILAGAFLIAKGRKRIQAGSAPDR